MIIVAMKCEGKAQRLNTLNKKGLFGSLRVK
jgi:hypothetical protein